ncbi:MAG: arginase family protein [Phormidesmis sp.]
MLELSHSTLNLFFPQWQGSGRIELYEGAQLLYESLCDRLPFTRIPTSSAYSLTLRENILGHSQILSQLSAACRIIKTHNPARILTLGGDCGVEIAPVSFLNQKYGRSLAIIWLDAHGDLNTPRSSPSGHFHGMPLRTLLGEGSQDILNQAFSTVLPRQAFLIGTRELDPPERSFVQENSLSIVSANAVNRQENSRLLAALATGGFSRLYIHLDLDVIDPEDFPHVACPTPHGINTRSLRRLLTDLKGNSGSKQVCVA